ncbi:rhomboid family intramembrane serine protease [Ornithinibacillus xuwenensis]|uniref:Rhomboid family intramembrane serine protease n=1 Tax=Ornithinibacillus xuwenensis TaxID=3144668 RepID=A0ABU9XCJ5_9BACI
MEREEAYVMYSLAHQLSQENGYDVLYINDKVEEVWLEKLEQKKSLIVRISTIGFDWKNHLKKDIAQVFQKTNAMRKMLQGKNIEVHNVYISPHTPVDSWEMLKKPMIIQEKNPIKMMTYYLSGEDFYKEKNRLSENLQVSFQQEAKEILPEEQVEKAIQNAKLELVKKIQHKQKEEEALFTFGKPIFTYLLIGINAILYLLLEINGGSLTNQTLIDFGAKFNPAIVDGEWWRLFTSMFLHIGFLHFASNMLFLYYFGSLAEKMYGSIRFISMYILAGVAASIASFAFVTNISAGASGALYGLFGAFIYFGLFYKRVFYQTIGKNILMVLALNIGLGFFLPQLDVIAHMGGLVAGFIAAGIVHLPKKRKLRTQAIAFIIYVVLVIGIFLFGMEQNPNKASYQTLNINMLLQEERYEEIVEGATKGLANPKGFEALLLFQRSYAYSQLEQIEPAIEDLEQCINVLENPKELPEAYYNLALLYQEVGDDRAEELIRKAYELIPSDLRIEELYKNITGE